MPGDKELARLFVGAIQVFDSPNPMLTRLALGRDSVPEGTSILEPLMYPEDKETKDA